MPDVILGIDPGSRNTGYALLTEENGKLRALRCDVIRVADLEDHSDRLQEIYNRIRKIIRSNKPTSCAVETPIYGVDPLAMLKLGRAQAAAMLAIKEEGLPVVEYYPKVVKKSITGNGNASKEQVAFMLNKMVSLPDERLSNDATDALAVAWCHLMKGSGIPASKKKTHQNRKKSDWSDFIADNPDRIKGL
ncbi:crossover junction endodeoxyribonuclease RuvC [Balneola sp. MJW-20]|uniref:crossover junction endodeoxyribonuclease RuvC n=1 Tax=Gracilimonas aurantiaca TaxID=3234185 RepID=UPI0034655751